MNLWTILLIVLIVVLIGGAPHWGYHNYGWGPSSGVGLVVVILIVLLLTGRL